MATHNSTEEPHDRLDLHDEISPPNRIPLPATRDSITHKFRVSEVEGYITVGLYENGNPGEVFVKMNKQGSTLGGMMDAFSILLSLCLQSSMSLEDLCHKFRHTKFSPDGMTSNQEIPFASSVIDYIFHWLQLTFL